MHPWQRLRDRRTESFPNIHAACLVTALLCSGLETTRRSLGRFLRRRLFADTRSFAIVVQENVVAAKLTGEDAPSASEHFRP
jgi:hypothetical protein